MLREEHTGYKPALHGQRHRLEACATCWDAGVPEGFAPIAGPKIGHAQDDRALTGCTVLLPQDGAMEWWGAWI